MAFHNYFFSSLDTVSSFLLPLSLYQWESKWQSLHDHREQTHERPQLLLKGKCGLVRKITMRERLGNGIRKYSAPSPLPTFVAPPTFAKAYNYQDGIEAKTLVCGGGVVVGVTSRGRQEALRPQVMYCKFRVHA